MRKLSRKEVIKGGPKKGKSKGNLKGKLRLGKVKKSLFTFYGIDGPKINKSTNELNMTVSLGEELLDNIRKIIREELDKPILIEYQDLVGTRIASSEIIDAVKKVNTKNSFVLVPKKKS